MEIKLSMSYNTDIGLNSRSHGSEDPSLPSIFNKGTINSSLTSGDPLSSVSFHHPPTGASASTIYSPSSTSINASHHRLGKSSDSGFTSSLHLRSIGGIHLESTSMASVKRGPSVRAPRAAYTGLNGNGYTLGKQRFLLPNSASFDHTDGMTGGLSTWPAPPPSKAASLSPRKPLKRGGMKSKSSIFGKIDERREGSEVDGFSIVPNNDGHDKGTRPKFLIQLEEFLERELSLIRGIGDGPSAARLAVYREAFHYFMEDFRTYKPFLSAVKNGKQMMMVELDVVMVIFSVN